MDRPIGDFFRFAFGLRRHPRHDQDIFDEQFTRSGGGTPDFENSDNKEDNNGDGFSFFVGKENGGLDDMFRHFQGDMFRQMESLNHQMEELMRGFGAITSDHHNPFENPCIQKPESEGHRDDKESFSGFFNPPQNRGKPKAPSDFMLKEEEHDSLRASPNSDKTAPDPHHKNFWFRWNLPSGIGSRPHNEKKEDTDLDDKVSQGEVLDLIKKSESANRDITIPASPQQDFLSSGSSFSMTTIQGPDGRVEHKKVVRDSSGRQETTVTRSIGDQTHTITTIQDEHGCKENQENFKNIDENDKKKFDEAWNSPHQMRPEHPLKPFDPSQPTISRNDRNLFARLFGGSW